MRDDLERGGIAESFEVVVTIDDVREPKPAPEGLLLALRNLALGAEQALSVTASRRGARRPCGGLVQTVEWPFCPPPGEEPLC